MEETKTKKTDVRDERFTLVQLGPAQLKCAEAESPESHVCHPKEVK